MVIIKLNGTRGLTTIERQCKKKRQNLKLEINMPSEKIFKGRITGLPTTVSYLRESAPRLHFGRTKSDELGGFC